MRDSVGHPSGACEVRYGEEEHRLKPVLPKTKTAADGCRFLEFSLDARLSLLGPRFKGQIGLGAALWLAAVCAAWLFAGEGELIAVGVFEDAAGAPFFGFGFLGELDAFGF